MAQLTPIALLILGGAALAASIPATVSASGTGLPLGSAQPQLGAAIATAAAGISVTGEGKVTLTADRVEVRIAVESKAETPLDALSAFNAKKALFEKAIATYEGIEIRSGGVKIGLETPANAGFNFGSEAPVAPKFQVSAVMTLTLPVSADTIQTIAEILDESGDLDCALVGAETDMVRAVMRAQGAVSDDIPDPIRYLPSREALNEASDEAMRLAFQHAKDQAVAAAQTADAKVGRVLALQILQPFNGSSTQSGSSTGTVRMAVRFEIL